MLKRIFCALLLIIPGALVFSQSAFVDKPVAIVKLIKTDVISQKKLARQVQVYEQQGGRPLSALEKEQVLQTLINQMLVYQAAERDNVTVTDQQVLQAGMQQLVQRSGRRMNEAQYRKFLEDQGIKYEDYSTGIRDQLILEKYVSEKKRDFIRAASMPDNAEIELFFKENESKFLNPEMVKFSHIFFATKGPEAKDRETQKSLAAEVYQNIVKGNNSFAEMVREYSDDKGSVVRDGDIGNFIDRSEPNIAVFGQDFLNRVFQLPTGEMSQVIESNQGFHIVIVNQHHKKRFLELDDPVTPVENTTVRQYIGNVLSYQKQQKAFMEASEQVVQDLMDQAEVQKFPENIQ